LPRTLSLELSVLPISGGQCFRRGENQFLWSFMELTGIEPVTSAVRLQRSPS
jgi:hypothetical protein